MKILLLADVPAQGKKGQVINVSDGYANNFLLKKGLGKVATPEVINQVKAQELAMQKQLAAEKQAAREKAAKLNGVVVNVKAKIGENGKLFGSITAQEISNELANMGYNIDKKYIVLPQPIKAVGEYELNVKVYAEINAKIKVVVC